MLFAVIHLNAAVSIVEVDDAADDDGGSSQQGITPEEVEEHTPTGGTEGATHTALLGAPLGVEPHGADDGQHQVDEEEQRQCQATVHLLRATGIEFQPAQPVVVGHQAADAVKVGFSTADELFTVFLDEAAGIDAFLQANDVLALRVIQFGGPDDERAQRIGHVLAEVLHDTRHRHFGEFLVGEIEPAPHDIGRAEQGDGSRARQHHLTIKSIDVRQLVSRRTALQWLQAVRLEETGVGHKVHIAQKRRVTLLYYFGIALVVIAHRTVVVIEKINRRHTFHCRELA